MFRTPHSVLTPVFLLTLCAASLIGQSGTKNGEWRTYGGDLGSTRYAPLDQINAHELQRAAGGLAIQDRRLRRASRLQPPDDAADDQRRALCHGRVEARCGGDRCRRPASCCGCIARRRQARRRRRRGSCPAAAWRTGPTARGDERDLLRDDRLSARRTGCEDRSCRCSDFGQNGIVDLKQNDDQVLDLITGEIGLNTAPVVAKNVVIVGAAHRERRRAAQQDATRRGTCAGSTCETGKRLWIFHTIPQPGEFGNDTWENDSWSYTGNAGVWAPFSVDEELGPRRTCRSSWRPATTTAATGPATSCSRKPGRCRSDRPASAVWHYQFVHHGIWDYDIPCAPDSGRHHGERPADQGAGAADQAGLPLRVRSSEPASRCGRLRSGRWNSPPCRARRRARRSRFPTKPPPFERQGFQPKKLIDFTPEIKAEALKVASQFKTRPAVHAADRRRAKTASWVWSTCPTAPTGRAARYDPETKHALRVLEHR